MMRPQIARPSRTGKELTDRQIDRRAYRSARKKAGVYKQEGDGWTRRDYSIKCGKRSRGEPSPPMPSTSTTSSYDWRGRDDGRGRGIPNSGNGWDYDSLNG